MSNKYKVSRSVWLLGQILLVLTVVLPRTVSANQVSALQDSAQCKIIDVNNASAELQTCINSAGPGAAIALLPNTYILRKPLFISNPIAISSLGTEARSPRCNTPGDSRCVTLRLEINAAVTANVRPITVTANDVSLDHLIVDGGRRDTLKPTCRGPLRRLGSGVGVSANNFSMTNSVLENVACDSALVLSKGANGFHFSNNKVVDNGKHTSYLMWSDGLTVLDASRATIEDNEFVDNTDVQLILGGCKDCLIRSNHFSHISSRDGAAFAELLIQSWPSTSGDYTGSNISGNSIDCGPQRNCGFGIGVGADEWYPSKAFNVNVISNLVVNAEVGLIVDNATGMINLSNNRVYHSGGTYISSCGPKTASGVNIAPDSLKFVDRKKIVTLDSEPISYVDFRSCLLLPPDRNAP